MQGLNVGAQRQRGSSSRLNELHVQTNTNTNGLNRYMEQLPLNNGVTIPVNTAYSVSSQGNQQAIHTGKVYILYSCFEKGKHTVQKHNMRHCQKMLWVV